VGDRRQDKTGQDRTQAALGGRLLGGVSQWNGCLESCAQSNQQQGVGGASKQAEQRPFGRSLLGPAPRGTEPELQCHHPRATAQPVN
jgi:hypothetical protein